MKSVGNNENYLVLRIEVKNNESHFHKQGYNITWLQRIGCEHNAPETKQGDTEVDMSIPRSSNSN